MTNSSNKRPNILFLLVDEERYPPIYENPEIQAWRKQNLVARQWLRAHGLEFHRHYIGSTACAPSRTTLFTGHYPSLHGVSQTDGIAKHAADPDMFWLDRSTVPTMGDYFREAGYQTFYRGKWHLSNEDILIPGTHEGLPSFNAFTGLPDRNQRLYEAADRLDRYGFSGWVGPEPHGKNPRNSGSSAGFGVSGRDEFYADETVRLISELDRRKRESHVKEPWLIVASFVNPHDIVLYGDITARLPAFRFEVEPMPDVTPPPTLHENLFTKPRCQASYRGLYPIALQPITNQPFYRKLYYQLQKNADGQMRKVLEALMRSSFYDDTIIVFTSDHGDTLGAHGGLFQKMYNAYEETLHVPLLFYNRKLIPEARSTCFLSSHLDVLPTLLGLAGISMHEIRGRLSSRFSEAALPVGRDLSSLIRQGAAVPSESPLYFMTDDDMLHGQHQVGPLGTPYPSVVQPNHIETVIASLQQNGRTELWKLSLYRENPQSGTPSANSPVPDEYELYSLTDDPLEERNLAGSPYLAQYTDIFYKMMGLLDEQRKLKRLTPRSSYEI